MNPVLQDPRLCLCADSTQTLAYRRDSRNYVTQLFGPDFPAVETGFFNIHMSQGMIVPPHWHTNADELVFVICGGIVASVFNPFTRKLITCTLKPGQVVQLPKGWFHWFIAITDNTHVLTIFDVPTPDVVFGADFLSCIPPEVMNRAFCINPQDYAKAVAPIQDALLLGPPPSCAPMAQGQQQGCEFPGPVFR